jgi:hypothetical protein
MPANPDYFTVTSDGIGSIGVDYVDLNTDPDEAIVYAFVDFKPRLPEGFTIWASGLTPPRGIILDDVRARFSPEDGKLRTIIAGPVNEKQTVTIAGDGTLTFSGQTTATIGTSTTRDQLLAALEGLSNIAVGDVFVSGATVNEKQTITIGGGATGGTFPLTFDGQTTSPELTRNATPSLVKAALQALSNIGSGDVSVTGPTGGPWIVEFTGALAGTNVPQMTTSAANLTGGTPTAAVTTTQAGSTGSPFTVTFQGAYAGTDVPVMVGTGGVSVSTSTGGTAALGVKLVANTTLIDLDELIYDVEFEVPDDQLDDTEDGRIVKPFAIEAPTTAGQTVDLATVTKLPHRSELGI